MTALLADRHPGWRDLLDLARGALDARLDPQIEPPRVLAAAAAVSPASAQVPASVAPPAAYGVVASTAPAGELSRRVFMRRMLAAGVGLLSLEFLGGTIAFLWPQFRSGLGAKFPIGTLPEIVARQASFANGWPYAVGPARVFLVNVPAGKELALGREATIPNPSAAELLALWRKCPHLGCQVPYLCDELKRFTCRCHGSTYNILGEKLKEGPAQRGMDRFAVTIGADGVVVVDTSQITDGALDRQDPGSLTFVDAAPYERKCQ